MSQRELATHALDRHSPRLPESDDETARGRCGHVDCGVSKSRWARLCVHGDGRVHGPSGHLTPTSIAVTNRHLQNGGGPFSRCHFHIGPDILKRVLYGISCRNYEAAAESVPGAIGLSSSTVSRSFIQASAATLRAFQERDLAGEDVVALFLDGKAFADSTMVIALGLTMSGEKRFLGFVETDTENAKVLTPFLPFAGRPRS